jgi:hypothetical protein|tara:strand:+ start:184 stop:306 length:123 start_codon:yes stop_codon:yes gene_type:complete
MRGQHHRERDTMSVLVGIVVIGTLAMLGFGLIIALIMTGE